MRLQTGTYTHKAGKKPTIVIKKIDEEFGIVDWYWAQEPGIIRQAPLSQMLHNGKFILKGYRFDKAAQ